MTSARRASLVALALIGMVGIGGERAGGFTYWTYGGYVVVWDQGQCLRYMSPSTFPAGGDTTTLYLAAMGQWSSVPGSGFQYYYYQLTEDPAIDHYDGYCDTAAVSASSLDPGVLAVTYMLNNGDAWFDMDMLFSDYPGDVGWHMLTEPACDVMMNPAPSNGYSFFMISLHELGHSIGLGESVAIDSEPGTPWFLATMNPLYPQGGPVGQENIVDLHTDDRNGARALYPGSAESFVDLANPGYCTQSGVIGLATPIFVEPAVAIPGEVVTGWVVIENFGTVGASNVRQSFYLSTDGVVDPNDMLMGDTLWNLPAEEGYEFSVDIDVPDIAAGFYYFGSILDDLDQVAEVYEDNNHSITCDTFEIAQALPTFDDFSQIVITCDAPFTGPTPVVHYPVNTAPITWSLDNPQPGMAIDPNTGVISWPEPTKSPILYEIDVRASNGAGSVMHTLELGVNQAAPQIVPISNHSTPCGGDYTGPTPTVVAPSCVAPILGWSLIDRPAGMTINPSSGVVSWSNALPGAAPHTVTIRCYNDVGETTESWLLYIGSADGDLDADGVVNFADYEIFEPCLAGPNAAIAGGCVCADFDRDDDVDLLDYNWLMLAYSGAAISQGACCFADGYCDVVTAADCYGLGGYYSGDGTTCASVDCSGACCFYTGGCLTFTLDNCTVAGGTFQGMGTECGELTCPPSGEGACCLPNEYCVITTPAGCASVGGTHRGVGLACEVVDCTTAVGACCHSDGSCSIGSESACLATGGTYMGDDSECLGDTCDGACCYPDGACLELPEPDCVVSAGVFQGAGIECASVECPVLPTGACCYGDNSCVEQTATQCEAGGGSYQGDGTTCAGTDCAARGACCLADEACIDVTEVACGLAGGLFIGVGSDCQSTDCSLSETGACYDIFDWTCLDTSPSICSALGGTYEGAGTTCATTMGPEYLNNSATGGSFYAPGASVAMADDMVLAGTARGLTYFELAVAGTGGGAFSVSIEMYDGCPGAGGDLIAGTETTWNGVPADGYIYTLYGEVVGEPIRLPDTVWMVASFSSADAGWVVAGPAETGFTDDAFGQNDPPWACDYWFGGPPNDYAGFWAALQCVDLPEPQGACCRTDFSCTEGPISECNAAGGIFMGEGVACAGVDCANLDVGACCDLVDWGCSVMSEADCLTAGGSYDGDATSCVDACPEYGNEIDPIALSYNPGSPMADDITLAGTARDLEYFDILVYGGGGGTFGLSAVFYDGLPCAGGVQIPATLVTGSGLPDNGEALNLTVTLPAPVTLPDDVWLVVEFSNEYAGWIVAEEAETGSTADRLALATYNSGTGQWEWDCNVQISDPSSPHAGFWTHVQCIDGAKGTRGGVPTITVTPVDLNGREVRSAFEPGAWSRHPGLLKRSRSHDSRRE